MRLAAILLLATACARAPSAPISRVVATPTQTPVTSDPATPAPAPPAAEIPASTVADLPKLAYGGRPAPGAVERMVLDIFGPVHGPRAVRIMLCESRGVPTARNGVHVGLFQVNERLHGWRVGEVGGSNLFDARTNVLVAKHLWDEQGWQPWACA